MMRTLVFAAAAVALLLASDFAQANWDIKAKLTCHEADGAKIVKEKGKNDDIIAACLGVSPEDPLVDQHALTFDSDLRNLHVIRRCDDTIVACDLSDQLSCQTATSETSSGYKTKRSCIDRLHDVDGDVNQGTMICSEAESYSYSSNKFKFTASCKGNVSADGLPCELTFKTGKLFEESGICPQ